MREKVYQNQLLLRGKNKESRFQPWGSWQRREERDYGKNRKERGGERETQRKIIVNWKRAREEE